MLSCKRQPLVNIHASLGRIVAGMIFKEAGIKIQQLIIPIMKKVIASLIFTFAVSASVYAQSTTQSTNPKQQGTATADSSKTGGKNEGTDTQGTTQGANHEVGNSNATQPGKAGQVNGSNKTSGTGKEGNGANGKSNVSKMNKGDATLNKGNKSTPKKEN
jgi:lipopolysaccharide export LptBFGC system permease protein LptF